MAIQKNFVVKNGIEVNENLIFADKDVDKVGIGTTVTSTSQKLQVNGGIGATSIVLTGVGTIPIIYSNEGYITTGVVTTISGTTLNYTDANIVTGVVTSITGTALTYTNADIGTLSVDNAYVVSGVVTNLVGTTLNYTDANIVTGVVTSITGTALTYTNADIGTLSVDNAYVVSGVVTNLVGTIGTFTAVDTTNLTADVGYIVSGVVTNIVGTSATIGTVEIVSGIITATSGIVTYYGDGTNLSLAGNPDLLTSSGIGIQTGDTLIGYGATFIEFRGPGVSTAFYDSSVGIATIYFQGGKESFSDGTAGTPSWYFEDDVTTGVFSPVNGELTFVSTGSSVLNINPSGVIVTGVVTATNFSGNLIGEVNATSFDTNSNGVIVTGVTTSTKANIGAATTFPEDLVVQGDARVTGILTVGTSSIILDGTTDIITVGSGATINGSNGNAVFAGSVTASSFFGDGSGLTGAGSTVADDASTNSTFYPVFTETTSGTITASKVSTTKLTFNPSTGTLTATTFSGALSGNSTTATTLATGRTINGVSFDGSANITVNPTSGAYSNGQGAKTIQSGGSASGGSSGDIYYIY